MDDEFDELGYWRPVRRDVERCCFCGATKEHHWPFSEEVYGYHEFMDFRSFVLIQLAGEWFTYPHAFSRYRLPDHSDPFERFEELGIDVKESQLCA